MIEHIKDYKGNPLEYIHDLVDQADKLYEQHQAEIATANNHLQLQSDHLAKRAGIGDRSAHYFPELISAIRARAANIFGVFTSAVPNIRVTPVNPDITGAREGSQRLEKWINECYNTKNLWLDWYMAFFSAELYPYSVVFLSWEDEWGQVPALDQMGGISYEDMITFSGPRIDLITPEDYRGDIYARHKKLMKYHMFTKQVSESYLFEGYEDGRFPLFDPNNIELAKAGKWLEDRRDKRFNSEYPTPKGYQYEITVCWTYVYNSQTKHNEWREIVFAGDMLLSERVRETEPPFFLLNSFPLPGEVAGLSTARLGEANQNMMNELWNQHIEANEQAIWSPVLFEGGVTSNPVWEPMALWQVENSASFKKLNEPRMAGDMLASIQYLTEKDQTMLAAQDITQPLTTNSKMTAREYVGKRESYSKVLDVNMEFYDAEVRSVNRWILDNARMHIADWIQIGILGGNGALASLQVEDLIQDVNIELPNVRQMAAEELEMAKWDIIYDKMMANPIVMSNPEHVHELSKRYLLSHKVQEVDKLIGEQSDEIFQGVPGGVI